MKDQQAYFQMTALVKLIQQTKIPQNQITLLIAVWRFDQKKAEENRMQELKFFQNLGLKSVRIPQMDCIVAVDKQFTDN